MRKGKQGYLSGLLALAAAMIFLFLLSAARAQAPRSAPAQQEQEKQEPIRVKVELVNLFATVRDGNRRMVPGLTKEDFQVFEDGQPQTIDFFSHETKLPITLGILMDTSGSMQNILGAEQEAASRFLARVMRKGDLSFIISFDVGVDLLADLTDDQGRLERAIQKARINAPSGGMINPGPVPQRGGGTNLYDAIYLACHEKLAGEAGRKALVVLTDAYDTGSRKRLEDAVEAAQRTDAVVHVLLLEDRRYFDSRIDVARKLADETGGRSIGVRSERDLEKAFDQISEELRSQYTLGYSPTNKARDGGFRKVKIGTTRGEMKVLARKGYYASKN